MRYKLYPLPLGRRSNRSHTRTVLPRGPPAPQKPKLLNELNKVERLCPADTYRSALFLHWPGRKRVKKEYSTEDCVK